MLIAKEGKNQVSFFAVEDGEVFIPHLERGNVQVAFLKMKDHHGTGYNAVRLDVGSGYEFSPSAPCTVYPSATLFLEGER